jgi:Flp pilus assembly secretin CpaC
MLSGAVSNPAEAQQAFDLAARLVGDNTKVVNSLVVRGRDQVMLKVTVAEVKRDVIKQLGIDMSGSPSRQHADRVDDPGDALRGPGVAQADLSRPDDGFADAPDPQTVLPGRLNRLYRAAGSTAPVDPSRPHRGTYGFILE